VRKEIELSGKPSCLLMLVSPFNLYFILSFGKVMVELGCTHLQFWQGFGEIGTSMPSLGYVMDDSDACKTCLSNLKTTFLECTNVSHFMIRRV
jgi:hypothetical protein